MQYHAIPCNTMQYHAIPCNTMQYNAIPCNTMQYNASLITADGAYHCPVGSIMAIFDIFFLYSFFAFVCPGWFVHFVFWFHISCKYVYTLTDRRQFHLFMILCLFLLKMQQESYICGCIYMCVCLSVFMLCVL